MLQNKTKKDKMMKVIIEITNHEEAQAAQNMLSAYLGQETPNGGPHLTNEEPSKPEKKVPATRAKDAVKKDAPAKKPTTKKPDPKPDPEPEADVGEVTQKELTEIAKAAVARTDRAQVKEVIGEYGEKISVVEPGDYAELVGKLEKLGAE